MNSLAHPALLAALFTGVIGAFALFVTAEAIAQEAGATATPFQAMVPMLPPSPVAARAPYEAELIEGDPERKNRWPTDQVDRLEDFTRMDLTRTERPDGVQRLERSEPAVGLVRPERIERQEAPARPEVARPEKVERPGRLERLIERFEKIDRIEKVERPERIEKVERVEKIERRERIERPERRERHERPERVDRSGRH
jgi:hypothetical protein